MDQEKIDRYIAEKRKQLNMTQQQLADRLSVTNKSVSRWENGLNMPDVSLLSELAEILDTDISSLLNGSETSDTEKDTASRIIDYSRQSVRKERKKYHIILYAFGIVVAFMIGVWLQDRYNTAELVKQEFVPVSSIMPFASLGDSDLVDIKLYSADGSQIKLTSQEKQTIFRQIQLINYYYLDPRNSVDRARADHRHIETRKGSFDISVDSDRLVIMGREYDAPWKNLKGINEYMNYFNFSDLNRIYCIQMLSVQAESLDLRRREHLYVYVWTLDAHSYRCYVTEKKSDSMDFLMSSSATSIESIRDVFKFYGIKEDKAEIIPVQHPDSTYSWPDREEPNTLKMLCQKLGLE